MPLQIPRSSSVRRIKVLTASAVSGICLRPIAAFDLSQRLMRCAVDNELAWLKGAFLQFGLPFRTGQGAGFPPS
ncbi:hypothetical protein D3C76_599050 [compost metagenome]